MHRMHQSYGILGEFGKTLKQSQLEFLGDKHSSWSRFLKEPVRRTLYTYNVTLVGEGEDRKEHSQYQGHELTPLTKHATLARTLSLLDF